jgi:hypothetical protein
MVDFPKVDSAEGIAAIMEFARRGQFVLNEYHEAIAKRHGVSTEGVVFARRLPKIPLKGPVMTARSLDAVVDARVPIHNI